MPLQRDHRLSWPEFFDRAVRMMMFYWPGSTRSLVLSLRLGYVIFTTVALGVIWRLAAMVSWVVDAAIAVVACLLFAYFFERSENE